MRVTHSPIEVVVIFGATLLFVLFLILRSRWGGRTTGTPASSISRDETVFAAIGHDGSPEMSQWPAPGMAGPIPAGGQVVPFPASVAQLGSEVWLARRRGANITLLHRVDHFDDATALTWAADCVEHAAQRVAGSEAATVTPKLREQIEQTVTACVAFARQRVTTGAYDAARAAELAQAAKHIETERTLDTVGSAVRSSLTHGWWRRRFISASNAEIFAELTGVWPLLEAGNALLDTDAMQGASSASSHARAAAVLTQNRADVDGSPDWSVSPPGHSSVVSRSGPSAAVASTAAFTSRATNRLQQELEWQMTRLEDYVSPAGAPATA